MLLIQTQFKMDRRNNESVLLRTWNLRSHLSFENRQSRWFLYLEPHSDQPEFQICTQLTQNNDIGNNNFMLYGACGGRGESTINSLSWDVEICTLPSKEFFVLTWKALRKERREENPLPFNTGSVKVVQWGRKFHRRSMIQVLW